MALKGWDPEGYADEIRLLMDVTDPDYLEPRMVRPASKECIRIPPTMGRFLDIHGILNADYERAAQDDPRFAARLLPRRQLTPLAGNTLVIVDSSQQDRSPTDSKLTAVRRDLVGKRNQPCEQ
jgi:hypothetical protein